MLDRTYRRRQQRNTRFQRSCRYLWNRAVAWGLLSYVFVSVYDALYGANPAIVHHLGMTLAVMCGGGALVVGGLFVVSKLMAELTAWWYHWSRGRASYGSE